MLLIYNISETAGPMHFIICVFLWVQIFDWCHFMTMSGTIAPITTDQDRVEATHAPRAARSHPVSGLATEDLQHAGKAWFTIPPETLARMMQWYKSLVPSFGQLRDEYERERKAATLKRTFPKFEDWQPRGGRISLQERLTTRPISKRGCKADR